MDTSVLFRSVTVSLPFCCTVQKNRQYFVPQLREQSSKCHFFSSQLSRSILVSGLWNCYHFLQLIQSYECLKNSFSRDHLIRCFCWPRLYDRNRRARSWHRHFGGLKLCLGSKLFLPGSSIPLPDVCKCGSKTKVRPSSTSKAGHR